MEDSEVFIKIVVVGDQGVGKTSILNKYCYGKMEKNQAPTIACDFTMKVLEHNGQLIRLQLWDIAGQERYKSVSKLYIRGAQGCLVVGDIKDKDSLKECLRWKDMISDVCSQTNGKEIPLFLIQNKVDETKNMGRLEDFQSMEYLEKFGKENSFKKCFQTSALEGTNVDLVFETLMKTIVESGEFQEQNKGKDNFGNTNNNNEQQQDKQQQSENNQKKIQLQNQSKQSSNKKKGCC
ncbi:P-loop containing nucleoside triphosphate hydrolase [Pseudocohnilembus persalinus]|uniref:p-loop containing nucleoside triphosphate hydrolase n=1 Tax=Pseudocohnilembus persalinus TaxID=266149 RepID=A0A0V0QDL6_PSEPJ|nr:P-loop containing nucleoside triphosphate hydrolase [Pseudocohnilembus persalinus]|eukprot:KRX00274.1 P-loop containing nucleoside triphosphate hydrolase [Pseudocohnilembus persalinus]